MQVNTERTLLRFLLPFPIKNYLRLSSDELEAMKCEAVRHNQLLLLYAQIEKHRALIKPAGVADDFLESVKNIYYGNVARSLRQEYIARRTSSLLSDEGVRSVLLRGNAIARDIYDDPYCRTSVDVDILIREAALSSADMILSKNGYVRNDKLPIKFWVSRIHHAVYSCPDTDDLIELHWNFSIPSFFSLSSAEIWSRGVQIEEEKCRLSPEMTIIHLLMHHYMHAFRELRILIDIIWALHKYEDKIDWKAFALELKKVGLLKTTLITLDQIRCLCREFTQEMRSIPILRQEMKLMKCKAPSLLYSFFKMDIYRKYAFQDKKDKFASRFALDKWSTIFFSFMKVLFPSPDIIKALYGNVRFWKLPLNYLRFIGWRVKEWTGRRA